MTTITAFILEDERKNRQLIHTMLTNYCDNIEVIGESSNINDAIQQIDELIPDLVFMDIQLGSQTVFELLDKIPERNFEIIFTTGFEKYAIQAIKYSGIDYLLKPLNLEDLQAAVARAFKKIQERHDNQDRANEEHLTDNRLVVPTLHGYVMLERLKVMYMAAEGAYTKIFLQDGTNFLVSNAIGTYEDKLPFPSFVRIHRSFMVNLRFIKEYIRGRGGYVLLQDGTHLNVSVRRKSDLLKALGL